MTRTLAAACQYLRAGFSLIPVKADSSKAPALASWKAYQTRQPTETELDTWFDTNTPHGIGLIHGAVSGHSEALDFDQPGLYEQFADLCTQQGLGELLKPCRSSRLRPAGGTCCTAAKGRFPTIRSWPRPRSARPSSRRAAKAATRSPPARRFPAM